MSGPLVGLIMGSISDLGIMEKAVNQLKELNIPFEKKVLSAHRMPKLVYEYASSAEERGLEVIIAGGMDSLLSIVQMPTGVPVATMAIGGAQNAAILAAQILGVKYPQIRKKIVEHKNILAKEFSKEQTEIKRIEEVEKEKSPEELSEEPFIDG
ncbi:MAG: AIR carboxylase family protein [Actinobacteria bacterium]|nr:AIR carboxylase family protein [Actinomycetota bacterium]